MSVQIGIETMFEPPRRFMAFCTIGIRVVIIFIFSAEVHVVATDRQTIALI